MSLQKIVGLTFLFCTAIAAGIYFDSDKKSLEIKVEEREKDQYDDPEQFLLFHKGIRTKEGDLEPGYPAGNSVVELQKAKVKAANFRATFRTQSNGVLEWKERGPANVAGRTRGILVDPDDATRNTWFVGSASGGVWKTTNAGAIWQHVTPDLPNLSTTVLAMAPSNSSIIYLGTGEGFGNVGGVAGNGMYKSLNKGQTWSHLPTTTDFDDVNRAIVHPTDPNIVVVATNNGIYRTTNGGTAWTKVYSESGRIQDLKMTPGNFAIQYATRNGIGVIKSIDGGASWSMSSTGMFPDARIEIDVSPAKPDRIFASVEGPLTGAGSDLYMSDNAGLTWTLVNTSINGATNDFLGGQGWYDNTILCDPFNANIVYFGGVGLYQLNLGSGSSTVAKYDFNENNTSSFLTLTSFTNGTHYDGKVTVGTMGNMSVEIRFGSGRTQKAHRFLVPEGATAGVPSPDYTYQNYVDVPFEVWDVTNNRQLMASFRDQGRDGLFNLILSNTAEETAAIAQSREYIYVNNVAYNPTTPNGSIAAAGGHEFNEAYFFWPVLSAGGVWSPNNLPTSSFEITYSAATLLNATTKTSADVYGEFDRKNEFSQTLRTGVHPDQHNMVAIPINASQKTYKILLANDGGIYESKVSTTPGTEQDDWKYVGFGYNTSQFYGVDKKPGEDQYFGGTQDNGTWRSFGAPASSASNYTFAIGGDGFEVLWHNLAPNKLIGGSQNNNFRSSTNGGSIWAAATTGITGTSPFISKLANSKHYPDRIFTLTSDGVFRSENFGQSWTGVPISSFWGSSAFMDVEVSRANADIVWAGSGMNATRKLHVSTDGGKSFSQTVNFGVMGSITKIASHPTQPNTAYALFSFADSPKILRTTNLGQTWEDISGFGNNDESTNGFPDVAVYSLFVRSDNTDIIWAGTEIGIFESLDNGQSWLLLEDFPKVAVWEMKAQDDQVVVATHGRGIWTATIDQPQLTLKSPELITHGTSPKELFVAKVFLDTPYDSVELLFNGISSGVIRNLLSGEYIFQVSGLTPNNYELTFRSYIGNAPTISKIYTVEQLDILSIENSYATYFANANDITLRNMTLRSFPGSNERQSIQTSHPYSNNTAYQTILRHPVKVSSTFPILYLSDLAITEPGKDTVTIEATKDGITWIPINSGYDASAHDDWSTAFNAATQGNSKLFREANYDLSQKFSAEDTLLFRLQLKTDNAGTSWGWGINYVTIQVEPLGVDPEVSGDFKIFPNPASEQITIEYTLAKSSTVGFQILDITGKTIATKALGVKRAGKQSEAIPLDKQATGNYILILNIDGGRKSKRFVIQR